MSYDLTLIGGRVIRVTDQQGGIVKDHKLNGDKDEVMEFGDDVIELNRIKLIEKVHDPLPDRHKEERALDYSRCRGQRSIQKEVMMLIRKKYPREWPKYFRDNEYKEKIRLWLHESSPKAWCDAKTGECSCDADYKAQKSSKTAVLDMFPGATEVEVPKPDRKDLE